MIKITQEVQEAIENKKPIILVETAFFTGTCEKNLLLEDIKQIEKTIRDQNVVPAFLGIIQGQIIVGLDDDQIKTLMYDKTAMRSCGISKVSYITSNLLNAGVNNTLMFQISTLLKLPFVVTGGIGGVSRLNKFDVSSDIYELSLHKSVAFCCGPKSMLDVSATRELLETYGISVVGYGTDIMPSFFSRESICKTDLTVNTIDELVSIIAGNEKLGINKGILVTIPISEKYNVPREKIECVIKEAIETSNSKLSDGYLLGYLIKKLSEEKYYAKQAVLEMFVISSKMAAMAAKNYYEKR